MAADVEPELAVLGLFADGAGETADERGPLEHHRRPVGFAEDVGGAEATRPGAHDDGLAGTVGRLDVAVLRVLHRSQVLPRRGHRLLAGSSGRSGGAVCPRPLVTVSTRVPD